MSPAPGTRLGHFDIQSVIGAGGMGQVFRAHDSRLDRDVAIKFLSAEISDEPARQRFQREAQMASALNHPHIVSVYDVGEFEGRQYIVTELVEGGTLTTWARAEKRSWRQIVDLLVGIADGLAAAHAAGILHRDIKPDNILITRDGRAKLTDFGLAKVTEGPVGDADPTRSLGQTRQGIILGTIAYMSPEQAEGKHLDARSDIFAYGVVLYEMLTGRRPFAGATDLEVLQTIIHGRAQPLGDDLPSPLRTVVEKTIEKDPAERYQSARDLVVDLRRLTRPSEAITTGGSRARRPRVWLAAAALVALGGLGGTLWRTWSTRSTPLHATLQNIRSIAVLPLQNLSRDPDQEFVSDGMTEELIATLAQIHSLRVISRTSVMLYKGNTTKGMREIGRELGADAIIEGSVRLAGGKVRVTAHLIHASTEAHLWAQEFDRDASDVLKLEADLARLIAQEIRVQITPEETGRLASARSVDPAAQQETLLGHYHAYKDSEEDTKQAIAHYQRAIQLQPEYAPAWAGLAMAWGDSPGAAAISSAKAAATKAIELDPDLGEAHAAMGQILVAADSDWVGADREFKLAVDLNPSVVDTCACYALMLTSMGRSKEALAVVQRALLANPLDAYVHAVSGVVLYQARRFDEAEPELLRARELDRHSPQHMATATLAQLYEATGRAQKAIELLGPQGVSGSPELGLAYAAAGRAADARRIAQALIKAPELHRRGIGAIYIALGETDQGLDWVQKSIDVREFSGPNLNETPFDPVREHPRFRKMLGGWRLPEDFDAPFRKAVLTPAR